MALEQLDVAAHGFAATTNDASLAEDIHRARKATKRLRALLRLVRNDLGTETYRNENVVLRDQAKRLSDLRIANVLIETLDLLVRESVLLPAEAVADLHRELEARRDALSAGFRADADGRAAAKMAITCTRARIAAWPGFSDREKPAAAAPEPDTAGYLTVLPGFVRVYERGRRAMKAARRDRTPAAFHEWRKQVNYLRYQIETLRGHLPPGIEAYEQPLSDLSETLGEDHDLADLGKVIEGNDVTFRGATERVVLLGAIERCRSDMERTALRSGKKIYRERPSQIEAELRAVWEQPN